MEFMRLESSPEDLQQRRIVVKSRGRDVIEYDPARSLPGDALDALDRDLLLRRVRDKAAPQRVTGEIALYARRSGSPSEDASNVTWIKPARR